MSFLMVLTQKEVVMDTGMATLIMVIVIRFTIIVHHIMRTDITLLIAVITNDTMEVVTTRHIMEEDITLLIIDLMILTEEEMHIIQAEEVTIMEEEGLLM